MNIRIVLISLLFLITGCASNPLDVQSRYSYLYSQMNTQNAISVLRTSLLPSEEADGIFECGDTFVDNIGVQALEVTSNEITLKAFGRKPIKKEDVHQKKYYNKSWRLDGIVRIWAHYYGKETSVAVRGANVVKLASEGGEDIFKPVIQLPIENRWNIKGEYQIQLWWGLGDNASTVIWFAIKEADLGQVLVALAKLAPQAKIQLTDKSQ